MDTIKDWIKKHQVLAYFIFTYVVTWTLLFIFQPFYLAGQRWVAPVLSLSIFAPALVSIGLSALLNSNPKQEKYKLAIVPFIIAWVLACLIILLYLIIIQQMEVTFRFVVVCVLSALLPAFVVASVFSNVPTIRVQLSTYIKPRGSVGYYVLALILIPAIWFFGNLLSRVLGMNEPISRFDVLDAKLVGMVLLFFSYNVIYGGLSEEPGWRGFALPRLQARFSPFVSSLILGVLWAVWHAPARFGGIEEKSISDTIVEWVLIVLVTIIFTWLFNRTQGSILVTALIHPAMNTTGNFLNASLGTLILLLGFTVFVIVYDRMWKKLDSTHKATYQDISPVGLNSNL